jgi:hypothetical protein
MADGTGVACGVGDATGAAAGVTGVGACGAGSAAGTGVGAVIGAAVASPGPTAGAGVGLGDHPLTIVAGATGGTGAAGVAGATCADVSFRSPTADEAATAASERCTKSTAPADVKATAAAVGQSADEPPRAGGVTRR